MNTHALDLETSSSQYASIADGSQTGLDLTGDFTFECWIKLESMPAASNVYTIFGKFSDQSDQRGYRLDVNSGGDIGVIVTDDGTWTDGHRLWQYGDANLTSGIWYHIAVSFTISTETFEFYKNGISIGAGTLVSGTNMGATLKNSTAPFDVGIDRDPSNNPRNYFDGLIDEIRVWSDVRTDTEIKENIFQDVTGQGNLVGYWKLNNDYTDSSGNSNTLTATNSPVFSTGVGFPEYTDINSVPVGSTTLFSDANLKAYYEADSVSDVGPNGYTLTNNNSVVFNSAKFNSGADFGSSNSTKYLNTTAFNLSASTNWSISLWLKSNGGNDADYLYLGDNTNKNAIRMRYNASSATKSLAFIRRRQNSANDTASFTVDLGTSDYHHLVLTYDGSTVRGYLNGILVASVSSTGNGASGTEASALQIGVANGNTGLVDYCSAILDDIALFTRVLTATEVFELYTGLSDIAYTRGNEAVLPITDDDLENIYTVGDRDDVETTDDTRVAQTGFLEHMIHQFKDIITDSSNTCDLVWEGQTTLSPNLSTVYLQIYNRVNEEWDTVDSDNTSSIDTDFQLSAHIADLTEYKDSDNIISCRVYQEAI